MKAFCQWLAVELRLQLMIGTVSFSPYIHGTSREQRGLYSTAHKLHYWLHTHHVFTSLRVRYITVPYKVNFNVLLVVQEARYHSSPSLVITLRLFRLDPGWILSISRYRHAAVSRLSVLRLDILG